LELLGEVIVPAMGSSVLFVVFSLIFPLAGLSLGKQVQVISDLTRLSTDERAMITSACGLDRQINGPAQHYYDCIRSQLGALRASPGEPDLTHLAPATRHLITSACELDRQINGPAQYYDCLRNHLASLGVSPVTTPGHTPAPGAQQRPTSALGAPSSATATPQKSKGLDPTILFVTALFGSLSAVYLYKRFGWRKCSGCGSRTSNSTRLCDSCRARFRAAEVRHQEEQEQQEAEARDEQQRRGEEEAHEGLRSLEDLQRLTGTDFERLIGSLFMRDGYKVSRSGQSGDEGIDMVLEMGGSKDVVQFKRWKGDIGPPVILEFYRSMMQAEARRGFVIATASFTHSAKELVDGKPITLIDGHYLLAWISWAGLAAEDARAAQRGSDFDPYEVLGISSGASKDEIRSAYRSLVAKYHPDKVAHLGHEFQAIAREKAIVINEAFEMLNHS
jgi:Restriction endonuclease/DnaJ domain